VISDTIRSAAKYFGVPMDDLIGTCRKKRIVRARCATIYVLRHRHNLSLPQIGMRVNRDHSSVMNALRIFDDSLADDIEVMTWVNARLAAPKRVDEPPVEITNLVRIAAEKEAKFNERPKIFPSPANKKKVPEGTRRSREAKIPKSTWETIRLAGCQFQINENGETRGELLDAHAIKSGTRSLLRAIQAHHPERCVA